MMKNIKHYKIIGSNLITLFWSKLTLRLGFKKDSSVIPKGVYCYEPDYEMNKKRKKGEPYRYYIKECRYYKRINKRYTGCSYLGYITDSFLLSDQCKICGENYTSS